MSFRSSRRQPVEEPLTTSTVRGDGEPVERRNPEQQTAGARLRAGLLFVLLLAGCASTPEPVDRDAIDIADRHQLGNVPFHAQDRYQCGPASLAMVLNWSGADTTPDALTPQVYLPARNGSLQIEMLAAARRHHRIPYVIEPNSDALLREVAAGHPVLVLQNLGLNWWPVWHYAVVTGYDLTERTITLHSGVNENLRMSLKRFLATWNRAGNWAVVITPPQTLPATAQREHYLQAILPLERLNDWQTTRDAYTALLARWPDTPDAWLGLGNSQYQLNDKQHAVLTYQRALAIDPKAAVIYNNLAHVLLELNRHDEAETAARHAVDIGGPHLQTYQQTLDEILRTRAGEYREP